MVLKYCKGGVLGDSGIVQILPNLKRFKKIREGLKRLLARFKKTLKDLGVFYEDASQPAKKKWRGAPCSVGEIGDLDGSGRPKNRNDTHSLKWYRAGFGPSAFNAISPAFRGRYLETPPLEIHPIPTILLGVRNNEWG